MTPTHWPLFASTSADSIRYLVIGWHLDASNGQCRPWLAPVDAPGLPYLETSSRLRYWPAGMPEPAELMPASSEARTEVFYR